jgi:S-DNA-T family DNA segregation ATPase FtsK/SpoIIIE
VTSVIVKRPPRRIAPPLPTGEVVLEPPPEIPPPGGKAWTRMLMILPMAAGGAAMGLMMAGQRGGSGPLTYVAGGMFGISILGMMGMMMMNQSGPGKKEMIEARRQYMRRLAQMRAQIRTTIRQQREASH